MLPLTIEEGDGEIQKSTDAPSSPGSMRYSDLSLKDLVCRCATDPRDDDAWEEFDSRIRKPIGLTIIRTARPWGGASLPLVEDLAQETYAKLWKHRCLLRDFAIQYPDDDIILRYIKRAAANATLDYFRRLRPISTIPIDPETEQEADRSQGRVEFRILLKEIDKHLKHCLTEPDRERDRTIFWLYFRRGMSTREIASLPTIGLSAQGVGSVIERLKRYLRERILRLPADSEDDKE